MKEKKEVNIPELINDYLVNRLVVADILKKYELHSVRFYDLLFELKIPKRGRKGKRKNNIILV